MAFQTKIKAFGQEACTKLFDMQVFKCITFEDCTCERTKNLPRNEHNFLKSQRTTRLLYIGQLNTNKTKRLQNITDNTNRKAHNLYLNHTQATPNAGYVDYEDEEMDCSSQTIDIEPFNLH
ncbi:hypothetical protein AVEN_107065-1 [Araneus ventricosus]|uniref:Uncharacterized protein n=1 Tax=Araneus ventricosus TaxID=182803 RepID=A0A4Y2UDT5_ARAVE|nr:hypothetical protein AVEN_107065-1 [Araneus ventricosus]